MKLFQSNRIYWEWVGLDEYQSAKKTRFNRRNVLVLCILSLSSTLCCVQFFHVSMSFQEYTHSAFVAIVNIIFSMVFAIAIFERQMFFDYLNCDETLINESE